MNFLPKLDAQRSSCLTVTCPLRGNCLDMVARDDRRSIVWAALIGLETIPYQFQIGKQFHYLGPIISLSLAANFEF